MKKLISYMGEISQLSSYVYKNLNTMQKNEWNIFFVLLHWKLSNSWKKKEINNNRLNNNRFIIVSVYQIKIVFLSTSLFSSIYTWNKLNYWINN